MTLLRFDPSGSLDSEFGITRDQLEGCSGQLLTLRSEMVAADRWSRASLPAGEPPPDGTTDGHPEFLWLPEDQLAAYERDREQAELGRIFRIANGMHDQIDAVVVLGGDGSCSGARALMEACCDPFHNELTRGARGSKPRMYFASDGVDNDAIAALLGRLAAGGYGDTKAEQRFAMVVISHDDASETAAAFGPLLASLAASLAPDGEGRIGRFVIPITGRAGTLHERAVEVGCEEILRFPDRVAPRLSVLSPVGLMPAAMLGLDCIKLLEGAAAVSEHFRSAPFDQNLVLQFVAVNQQLAEHRGKTLRVIRPWSEALHGVARWYDRLMSGFHRDQDFDDPRVTAIDRRDFQERQRPPSLGRHDQVIHNLVVEKSRNDLVTVGPRDRDLEARGDRSEKTFPELTRDGLQSTSQALRCAGCPAIDLVLPTIDTYFLGQLFQMLMIAAEMERRWRGPSSPAPRGVDQHTYPIQQPAVRGEPA